VCCIPTGTCRVSHLRPQVKLGIPGGDALRDLAMGTVPLARLGTAEEAAGAILMLASPWASYITGQVLEVNGGSYM
jgi:3-oxoacyl-[acyl-carrier protein] reductase